MTTTTERDAILALESARQRALIDGDIAALDAMFEESLVHIHAPGVVHTKAMLLEHTATRRAYVEISRGELTVRVFGDTAVMTGSMVNRLRNPDASERTVAGEVTQVLVRGADGVWRFASFQMTPYGEQVWGRLPSEQGSQEQGSQGGDAENKGVDR